MFKFANNYDQLKAQKLYDKLFDYYRNNFRVELGC